MNDTTLRLARVDRTWTLTGPDWPVVGLPTGAHASDLDAKLVADTTIRHMVRMQGRLVTLGPVWTPDPAAPGEYTATVLLTAAP